MDDGDVKSIREVSRKIIEKDKVNDKAFGGPRVTDLNVLSKIVLTDDQFENEVLAKRISHRRCCRLYLRL